MTTCDEIKKLLDTKDLEKIKIEFKRLAILNTSKGQVNLAKELVALANHSGGKLIIGLTNEGEFEGKDTFDAESLLRGVCL